METSLKTGFAQIFSRCPKNLSCPKFGGAAAPLAPPGPYAYVGTLSTSLCEEVKVLGDIICSVKLGRLHNQDYKETTISFCLN